MNLKPLALAVLLCTAAPFALAQPAALPGALPQGPVSTLDAQASLDVKNDEMTVTMRAVQEGPQVQVLSQAVLATLKFAQDRARKDSAVKTTLSGISTYPVWAPKSKTANWTVRAELVLTSRDFAALGTLASELTRDMQIANVSFGLSKERRKIEQERLMTELAQSFQDKAQAITRSFGYKSYQVRTLNFTEQQFERGPAPMMMAMRASVADAAPTPIPAEGGNSSVSISVAGTIEHAR